MKVIMPDAIDHLRFTDEETGSRDPEMFKRFLKGACILNFAQRPHEIDGDLMIITSSGEDYKKDLADANAIFSVNQKQRKYRLSGTEEKVLNWIIKITSELNPLHETDLNEIADISKIPYKTVYNAIFGTSSGVGGLKAKIPGLKIEDVAVKIDNTTTKKKLITMSKPSNKAGDGYWGSGQFAYYD